MLIADADIDLSELAGLWWFLPNVHLSFISPATCTCNCACYWYWWFCWFCCWWGCFWCCRLIMRMMMTRILRPISRRHPSALWFLLRYLLPMLVARQRHRYKPEGKPMGTLSIGQRASLLIVMQVIPTIVLPSIPLQGQFPWIFTIVYQ